MAAPQSKKASGASKKAAVAKRSGRKSKRSSYALYFSRVLRYASKSKLTLSSKSVEILDSLVLDLFERLATEAASLARGATKRTLGAREVQTAVRLTLPAELAKHAMTEGTRAVVVASSVI
jgi:histone H2B